MLDWFKGLGENVSKVISTAGENVGSVLLMVGIIVALFVVAEITEIIIFKKNNINRKSDKFKIHRMTLIAIMSVIALVLDQFGIYLVPDMYKINLGDLPCVICSFTMGPVAGILTETIKVLLNLVVNGTKTAFIGEFANFAMGCGYVLPAAIIYFRRKNRKNAIIALITGTVICTVMGVLMNAFVLLPFYAKIYSGGDVDKLISSIGSKKSIVTSLKNLLILIVIPCNFIKCAASSIITMVIYKPISHLIKQNDYTQKADDQVKKDYQPKTDKENN